MNNFKAKIRKLKDSGFFSIYISTIASKVITLFGGILIVRIFSQSDYSVYTLVNNVISVLCFFGDFGASSALLQFMIENNENNEKQNSYICYGIKIGLLASIISCLLLLFSNLFYPYKNILIAKYATLLFLIPILINAINIICVIIRAKEENKKYSVFQFLIVFIHYIISIALIIMFGLFGSIISQYVYNIVIFFVGLFILKTIAGFKFKKNKGILLKKEKKEFIKLAFGSQINNTISNLLYTIDIFILGILIVDNTTISYYKVATIIPNALAFLPQCLMIYLIPYLVKNNKSKSWIKNKFTKVLIISGIGYSIIGIVFIVFSKFIISVLYGQQYMLSIKPFIILTISFIISSSIKIPISNLLYTMHKVNINILISIIGIIFNFILNYILVIRFGYIGAAYATLIVVIIMSLLNIFFLFLNLKKIKN